MEKFVKDKKVLGSFRTALITLKKHITFKKLEKKITFVKFYNSQELINAICTKQKGYYIINKDSGNNILKLENIKEEIEKEITYKITKDNILIYFKDNDFTTFTINKKILIGKSNLIKQNENLLQNKNENKTKELKDETDNNEENPLYNSLINIIRNKYKDYIEILIRFFIYQKEKTTEENQCFSGTKEQNKESVYLINSKLIEKIKELFEYEKIKEFIIQQMSLEKINSKSDDKCFENIISKIPNECFKKLIGRDLKTIEEEIIKDIKINFEISKIMLEEKLINIKYFSDFLIVNSMINNKLMNLQNNLPEIKADLYYIGNNKLLLSFPNQISCDEIGIINEQNLFIPEYILYYTKNNVEVSKLNTFIKNLFNNDFTSKPIYDVDKLLIGYCFPKNELNKKIELKENNINLEKLAKNRISLQNVLSIMIEAELIKKKMKKSLKGSKEEKYYFLNSNWLNKYIELKNMKEIIDNLIEDKIIESYIKNKNEENIVQYNLSISEIMKNIDENKIKKISINNDDLYLLSDKKLFKLKYSLIKTSEESHLLYYQNFILISSETKKLLSSEFPSHLQFELKSFPVYFGDNKVFIIIQSSLEGIIEVYHIDNNNEFQPIIFFEHPDKNNLITNTKLLTSYEYSEYSKYFLLFDEDYISPIFDLNNNRIGRAYRYNKELKDYSKYTSQEEKVKYMIKLYFSNYLLRTKFNNKIEEKQIFIINENYLKNLKMYSLIHNKLNQLDLSNELNDIMNSNFSEKKLDELIDGKKMSLKMKNILSVENDNILIQKDNIESEEPNLLPYNGNGKEFFYFDNFRLIDISLGKKLLKN